MGRGGDEGEEDAKKSIVTFGGEHGYLEFKTGPPMLQSHRSVLASSLDTVTSCQKWRLSLPPIIIIIIIIHTIYTVRTTIAGSATVGNIIAIGITTIGVTIIIIIIIAIIIIVVGRFGAGGGNRSAVVGEYEGGGDLDIPVHRPTESIEQNNVETKISATRRLPSHYAPNSIPSLLQCAVLLCPAGTVQTKLQGGALDIVC